MRLLCPIVIGDSLADGPARQSHGFGDLDRFAVAFAFFVILNDPVFKAERRRRFLLRQLQRFAPVLECLWGHGTPSCVDSVIIFPIPIS